MSLLFRSNREIKRRKINKFQTGGDIPFYATYQIQPIPYTPYDPSALLQKYKASTAKTASDKKEKSSKLPEMKYPEAVGLPIDNFDTQTKAKQLFDEIQWGLNNVDGFEKTDKYFELRSKYEYYLNTQQRVDLAQEEAYKENIKALNEQDGANSDYYDDQGRFLASVLIEDEEGNKKSTYSYLTPEELRKGGDQWKLIKLLTYKDVANLRAEDINFRGDRDIISNLRDGVSYRYIKNEWIDKAFNDVGFTDNISKITQGGKADATGQILENFTQSRGKRTNETNIDFAFQSLLQNMDPKVKKYFDAKLAFMPLMEIKKDENGKPILDENGNKELIYKKGDPILDEYGNPTGEYEKVYAKTEEEKEKQITNILQYEYLKRYQVTMPGDYTKIYDTEVVKAGAIAELTGAVKLEGPGKDWSDANEFELQTIDGLNVLKGNKYIQAAYYNTDANEAKDYIQADANNQKRNKVYLKNETEFNKIADLSKATIGSTNIRASQVSGSDPWDSHVDLLSGSIIDKNTLKGAYLPINADGSVFDLTMSKEQKLKYANKIKNITAEKGTEAYEQEYQKILKSFLPENVTIKRVYIATAYSTSKFFDDDVPVTKENLVKPMSDMVDLFLGKIVQPDKTLDYDPLIVGWVNNPDEPEVFAYKIVIPARSNSKMMDSYVAKQQMSLQQQLENPGKTSISPIGVNLSNLE
jgi:hypothetical protein